MRDLVGGNVADAQVVVVLEAGDAGQGVVLDAEFFEVGEGVRGADGREPVGLDGKEDWHTFKSVCKPARRRALARLLPAGTSYGQVDVRRCATELGNQRAWLLLCRDRERRWHHTLCNRSWRPSNLVARNQGLREIPDRHW